MGIQLVVASGSRAGQVIPIVGERFVIGRGEDCNLKPRSELISRYHCEIFLLDGDFFVRDMGSKNGVFLNEKQITDTNELRTGDKLAIGPLEFFVHISSEEKAGEGEPLEGSPTEEQPVEEQPASVRPQRPPKVKSVSDAVARTVALQSEKSEKSQEESIADWLITAEESGDELETRTIDATELMAHLRNQSEETADRDSEDEYAAQPNAGQPSSSASSRDAASELLRKFFKGGK